MSAIASWLGWVLPPPKNILTIAWPMPPIKMAMAISTATATVAIFMGHLRKRSGCGLGGSGVGATSSAGPGWPWIAGAVCAVVGVSWWGQSWASSASWSR